VSILVHARGPGIGEKRRPLLAGIPFLGRIVRDQVLFRRLWRYAVTSVVATVVSEATLLCLFGAGLLDATSSAVAANLTGTFPSYAMSRYWIWPEADRRRPVRQVVGYWVISIVNLVASSAATGVAAANAPRGQAAHLFVVATAYLGTYAFLWVAKFVIYQKALFRSSENSNLE
jgi:putative flippase GtrA